MTQAHKQWIKNKTPLLREFTLKKRALLSKAASNNYSKLPGWVHSSYNDLELETKLNLSELNYKILSEMVDQDLKQAGVDYDIAYKNAAMAWEAEKAALLAAWEHELANIKLSNFNSENEIELLAIEVAKRGIALLEAKTVIDLEAEGIRKQIAELDGQTGSYEVQLANTKVLTAQKKLTVIPIIQQLITLEQQALVKEMLIVDKNQEIINKQYEVLAVSQLIVDKTYELIPKQQLLLAKDEILIGKDEELIVKNEELLVKEESIVDKQSEVVAKALEAVAKEAEVITKKEELVAKEYELIAKEEEVIAKSLEILSTLEQVANVKRDIADIQDSVITKAYTVLAAEQALLAADYLVLDAKEDLVAADADLITAEEDYIADRIAKITPALNALLLALDTYITEIQRQTEIYAAIVSIKQQIAALQLLEASKASEILVAQYSLLDKLTIFANATKSLSEYKQLTLAPALCNFVVELQAYGAELTTQVALEKNIIERKVDIISLGVDEAETKVDIAQVSANIAEVNADISDVRNSKEAAAVEFSADSMSKRAAGAVELASQKVTDLGTIETERQNTDTQRQEKNLTYGQEAEDLKTDHFDNIEEKRQQVIRQKATDEKEWIRDKATANAAPEITASLKHLLGSGAA